MKTYFKHRIPIALGFALFITACNGVDNGSQSSVESASTNAAADAPSMARKIYVDNATAQEISDFVTACKAEQNTGKSSKFICVQICHVPPGNSAAQHTKVLPLPATLAHLGHGDYLGACTTDETDDGGAIDSGGGTGEEPGTGEEAGDVEDPVIPDDGGGEETPPDISDLPLWCQQNYAIDSDCDGWDDITGQPLY